MEHGLPEAGTMSLAFSVQSSVLDTAPSPQLAPCEVLVGGWMGRSWPGSETKREEDREGMNTV